MPATALAEPAEHSPDDGVVDVNAPCAGPHSPFTVRFAEHEASEPPLIPLQFQSNGPVPVTDVALPVAHRPEDGAVYTLDPFAGPHVPLIISGAEHDAFVPPLIPLQLQFHVLLEFVTEVELPAEHNPDDGDVGVLTPFAVPQTPSIVLFALQFAVVPPLIPAHVHVHGPVPPTADAVPTEHRFDDGAV